MHRRAFYAYAYVYVIAINKKTNQCSLVSTAIQEPATLKCEFFHSEQKRKNGDGNANYIF